MYAGRVWRLPVPALRPGVFLVKASRSTSGTSLRFVFRNFPLNQAHPYAELAAESAEAAGLQGKFWEMAVLFLQTRMRLGQPLIEALVERLIWNSKVAADLETREFQARVRPGFHGRCEEWRRTARQASSSTESATIKVGRRNLWRQR